MPAPTAAASRGQLGCARGTPAGDAAGVTCSGAVVAELAFLVGEPSERAGAGSTTGRGTRRGDGGRSAWVRRRGRRRRPLPPRGPPRRPRAWRWRCAPGAGRRAAPRRRRGAAPRRGRRRRRRPPPRRSRGGGGGSSVTTGTGTSGLTSSSSSSRSMSSPSSSSTRSSSTRSSSAIVFVVELGFVVEFFVAHRGSERSADRDRPRGGRVVSGAVGGLRGAEYNTRTCVQSRPKPARSYTYSPGGTTGRDARMVKEGAQETVGATGWPDLPVQVGLLQRSLLGLLSPRAHPSPGAFASRTDATHDRAVRTPRSTPDGGGPCQAGARSAPRAP